MPPPVPRGRPTLLALIREHLPDADPIPVDDGYRLGCPSCRSPHTITLRAAPGVGAYVMPCRCGTPLHEALDLPEETLDALLTSVRVPTPGDAESSASATSLASELLTLDDLADLPEPSWVIDGALRARSLAFIVGPPSSGKSFHLINWLAAVATGTNWAGREVRAGRVLYVAGEGLDGIHARVTAWSQRHEVPIPGEMFDVFPRPVSLAEASTVDELEELVRQRDYSLIVLDTWARMSTGVDENSAGDVGRILAAADRLWAATTSGTVVFAHHSGKGSTDLRGSSALRGAAETVFLTSKRGDDYALEEDKQKSKSSDYFSLWRIALPGGNPVLVSSTADDLLDEVPVPTSDARLWEVLNASFAHGSHFTRAEAVRLTRDPAHGEPLPSSTAYRAFAVLVDSGVVLQVAGSPTASDRYTLDEQAAVSRGYRLTRRAPRTRAPGEPSLYAGEPDLVPF
ncbi:AAA family ATPase [Pseudokineococcus basanitobsidens]|uniref:AAA family ATPase n=1 Tax=Pseudokineococcus basanitobsidens TaxID=1926649 RepID=A0ABU8RMH4_9ACTN